MGPTRTLYRYGAEKTSSKDENDDTVTVWNYMEIAFDAGEYELVRQGMLPSGASWTDELRRIERGALLSEADKYIQEGEDHVLTQKDSEWTDYVKAMREYKQAIRATVDDEGFPAAVEYPEMPEQPQRQRSLKPIQDISLDGGPCCHYLLGPPSHPRFSSFTSSSPLGVLIG